MLGEAQGAKPEAAPRQTTSPNGAPAYQHRQRPDMPPPPVPAQQAGASSSADSNTTKSDSGEEVVRKKVGGFAMPNGAGQSREAPAGARAPAQESAADAAARRRAAIRASFNNNDPESSRIPNGGIDGVASKANAHLQAHGANLDIGKPESSAGYSGFSSARGIKREG